MWHIATGTYHSGSFGKVISTEANFFDAVAISEDNAWAIGEVAVSRPNIVSISRVELPIMLHWDGTKWGEVKLPRMPSYMSGTASNLSAMDASVGKDVWVVGAWADSATIHPYAARLDEGSWKQVDIPEARNSWTKLNNVEVRSVTDVWVKGYQQSRNPIGPEEDLSLHWDGSTWEPITWDGNAETLPPDTEGWIRDRVLPTLGSRDEFFIERIAALSKQNVWVAGAAGYGDAENALVAYFQGDDCPWGRV